MVMMGKHATVVRDSTAGMALGVCLGCVCNADTWKGSLRIGMEWGDQVKADIPDNHEQHQQGALAPQKRRGLRQGEAIPSGPKTHSCNLSAKRVSQLDAKGISRLPGPANRLPEKDREGSVFGKGATCCGGFLRRPAGSRAPRGRPWLRPNRPPAPRGASAWRCGS